MNTPDPKQKALELVEKFIKQQSLLTNPQMCKQRSKKCAIIAVKEILELPGLDEGRLTFCSSSDRKYWQSVLTEIEKI